MTDFKFEPSDFSVKIVWERAPLHMFMKFCNESAAEQANAKLEEIKAAWMAELVSSGIEVKSDTGPSCINQGWYVGPQFEDINHTHEALLINIKPIERECAHSPVNIDEAAEMLKWTKRKNAYFIPCYKCGRTLVPKWSVVGDK